MTISFVSLAFLVVAAWGMAVTGHQEADSDGVTRTDADGAGGRPLPVRTVEALPSDTYVVSREFVGRIEPARSSNLGFERDGLLEEVSVDEGDRVEQGAIVARLDVRELESRRAELSARQAAAAALLDEMTRGPRQEVIAAARAEVAAAEARASLAQVRFRRAGGLREKNAITAQEWDEARFEELDALALAQAAQARLDELLAGTRVEQIMAQEAQVRQLQAEIATLDIQIEKSTLKAPFAGTIAIRHADEGEVLSTGAPVAQLLETGRLDVRVGLAGDSARQVAEGQELSIRVAGATYPARVRAIRPDRGGQTRSLTVLLHIVDVAEGTLRCGDLATVRIDRTESVQGFWLPMESLAEGVRGLWSCYVAEPIGTAAASPGEGGGMPPDGTTRRLSRRVLELIHQETDRVYVRGELSPGERVVAAGVHRLVPGQRVGLVGKEVP